MRIALVVLGLMLVGSRAVDKCNLEYSVTEESSAATRIDVSIVCPVVVIKVPGRAHEVLVRFEERVGGQGQGGRGELLGVNGGDEQGVNGRPSENQVQGEGHVDQRGHDGVELEEGVEKRSRDVGVQVEERGRDVAAHVGVQVEKHADEHGGVSIGDHGHLVHEPRDDGGQVEEHLDERRAVIVEEHGHQMHEPGDDGLQDKEQDATQQETSEKDLFRQDPAAVEKGPRKEELGRGGFEQSASEEELGQDPAAVEQGTSEEGLGQRQNERQSPQTTPETLGEASTQSPAPACQEMEAAPQTFVKISRILVLFIDALDQQLHQITRSVEEEQRVGRPMTDASLRTYHVRILKEEGVMCAHIIRCNRIIIVTPATGGSISSLTHRLEEQKREINQLILRLMNAMSIEGTQTRSDANVFSSADQDTDYSHFFGATITELHYYLQWQYNSYNAIVLRMKKASHLTVQTYNDNTDGEERKELEGNWLTKLINDGIEFMGRGANSIIEWHGTRHVQDEDQQDKSTEESFGESFYKPQPYEDFGTVDSPWEQARKRMKRIYASEKSPEKVDDRPGLEVDHPQLNPLIEEINKAIKGKGYNRPFTSSDLKMMAELLNMFVYASDKELARITSCIEDEEVTTGKHSKEELAELMRSLKSIEDELEKVILPYLILMNEDEKLGSTATEDYGIIALVTRTKELRDQCNRMIRRLSFCISKWEQRGADSSINYVDPRPSDGGACDKDFLNDYFNEMTRMLEKILSAIQRVHEETINTLQQFLGSQVSDDNEHIDCPRRNEADSSLEHYGGINDEKSEEGEGNWLTNLIEALLDFISRSLNWLANIADRIVGFIVSSLSYVKSLVLGQLLQPIVFTAVALASGLIIVIGYPMITTGVTETDESNHREGHNHVFPHVEIKRRENADSSSDSGMNTTAVHEDQIRQTREESVQGSSQARDIEQNASEDEPLGGKNTSGLGEDKKVTKKRTTSQTKPSKTKTKKPRSPKKKKPATNPPRSDCQDEFQLRITTLYLTEEFEGVVAGSDSDSNEER